MIISIRLGSQSSVIVDRLECEDQCDRLNDIQLALYHAQSLLDAVTYDRLEKPEARAAAYFAAFALGAIAEGPAEDPVVFMDKLCARIENSRQQSQAQLDALQDGGAA